jgi:hypothetical protein
LNAARSILALSGVKSRGGQALSHPYDLPFWSPFLIPLGGRVVGDGRHAAAIIPPADLPAGFIETAFRRASTSPTPGTGRSQSIKVNAPASSPKALHRILLMVTLSLNGEIRLR